jgi:predicted Rossmann fold flavoprotein
VTAPLAGQPRADPGSPEHADLCVVGAGAAGLFAAIWAARTASHAAATGARPLSVLALDGAARIGAKILVAGGGRCNVTHHAVHDTDYSGSTPAAIRSVLRRFGVERTVEFFSERGVTLKREDTGKLFPTTDDAHTVLDALMGALRESGASLKHPWRVSEVRRTSTGFEVGGPAGAVRCSRLILASGGRSLPKSGSDGAGLEIAQSLGHSATAMIVPALVPLVLAEGHWIRALSGLTVDAEIVLRSSTTRKLRAIRGSTLCTHFGISGPSVLDMSRHWHHGRAADAGCSLELCWLPGASADEVDAWLVASKGTGVAATLRERVPERLARALCAAASVPPDSTVQQLGRDRRRALAALVAGTPLPVTGDRGWNAAEVTAGGIPLAEVDLRTMESRVVPGLHLAGEICDVDGRIGGFNFQWAWASGFVAGCAAAEALALASAAHEQ